ncbi:MAG: hypothetical protein IPM50_06770 [Acidobacteriota bacterium]|nr:MAG: hypothetical protein IPM50_06770 [Acidobacteriota bacterium]
MRSDAEQNPIRYKLLLLLIVAATAPAGILGWIMDIRFDEAFTLETTSRGFLYAIKQAIEFEQQAPLYFALLSLWRRIDLSIFFARTFSLLFYPISIWLAAEAGKRYVRGVDPLIIAAAFSVHQLVFWATLDIRLYTFITALSAGMLVCLYDGYLKEEASRSARVVFLCLALTALHTQYYLGFQLAAGAAALAACEKWEALKRYIFGMAVVGLFFIPMALVVVRQAVIVSGHTDFEFTALELAKEIYRRVLVLFVTVEWIEPEWLKVWLGRLIVLGFGTLIAAKAAKDRILEDRFLVTFVAVQVVFFAAAITFVGVQPLQARHMMGLILPLAVIQFSALRIFRHRAVITAWLLFVLVSNIAFISYEHRSMAKPGDFRRMAEYVANNEEAGQPVMIVHADAIYPFRNYYHGINHLDALPQINELTSWNPKLSVFRDDAQVESGFNRWPQADRFWLVSDGWCAHGTLTFNCEILENFISTHFVVEAEEQFAGSSRVRLISRR